MWAFFESPLFLKRTYAPYFTVFRAKSQTRETVDNLWITLKNTRDIIGE